MLEPYMLGGPARALYDQVQQTMVPWAEKAGFQATAEGGRLIGPFNVMLFSPELGGAFLAAQKAEEAHTALSERVRQVVIPTVGSVWQAAYELYAHSAVARQAGLDDATVAMLARGEPANALGDDARTAQRFTRQLVATRRVDDESYRAARAAFGEKGVVDMIMLAGCYQVVCSLLNAFEVPAPQSIP